MSTRVSPLERIRADIDGLFASERDLGEVLGGGGPPRCPPAHAGCHRSRGHRVLWSGALRPRRTCPCRQPQRPLPDHRLTTTGAVSIGRPKLRDTDEAFASRLLGVGVCRTNALESLVIAGFVRGLSVPDVDATLADALGTEAALSKSTVAKVCAAIKAFHS